jgi:hypothetical protein
LTGSIGVQPSRGNRLARKSFNTWRLKAGARPAGKAAAVTDITLLILAFTAVIWIGGMVVLKIVEAAQFLASRVSFKLPALLTSRLHLDGPDHRLPLMPS